MIAATTMMALLAAVLPAAARPTDEFSKSDPLPSPGIYADGAITVTTDGWIHYKSDLEALGKRAKLVAVPGIKEADGSCTWSGSESGGQSVPTSTIREREEVAFNPATCQSKWLFTIEGVGLV